MNEIADLLRELAAQLGTTVEALWPMIVAKMQYDWLGQMVTMTAMCVVGFIVFIKAWRGLGDIVERTQYLKCESRRWDRVIDSYRYNRVEEEKITTSYEEAIENWSKANSEWERLNETAPILSISLMIVGAIMAIFGTAGTIITAANISQFLVPEAAALQYIMGLI